MQTHLDSPGEERSLIILHSKFIPNNQHNLIPSLSVELDKGIALRIIDPALQGHECDVLLVGRGLQAECDGRMPIRANLNVSHWTFCFGYRATSAPGR